MTKGVYFLMRLIQTGIDLSAGAPPPPQGLSRPLQSASRFGGCVEYGMSRAPSRAKKLILKLTENF